MHFENFAIQVLISVLLFFLLVVDREAYTYMGDQRQFVQIDQNDLYPYLLVNVGPGVSMIRLLLFKMHNF